MSATRATPLLVTLATAVAVLGSATLAAGQCFVAKLTPPDPQVRQYFGESLAPGQGWSIIGALGDNERAVGAGAAYGFSSSTWQLRSKLTASDGQDGDGFSRHALALDHWRLLVGAMGDDDRGNLAGAAYYFEQVSGENWREVVKLHAGDARPEDRFGCSLALHAAQSAFGAYRSGFAGATYIFEQVGQSWRETQKLTPTGATLNAFFGERIAVDGDTLAGGAVFDSERGNLAGAVFVFERGGDGRWAQVAKLMASDGGENDQFGYALAIQGDTLFVGAPLHNGFASNGGAVYVFHRDAPGVWTQVAKLGIPGAVRDDLLGGSLAIEGELLAVGADPYEDPRGHFAGDVRLFREESPGEWRYLMRIATDDRRGGDVFGYSLALQAGMLLVGAPFHDGPAGEDSGAVYVYDLTRGPGGGLIGKPGDINKDGVTDLEDYKLFAACLTGPETPVANLCLSSRLDCDADADLADLAILQQHLSGE